MSDSEPRKISPQNDARDARFLDWWRKEGQGGAYNHLIYETWMAAWEAALAWERMEYGRG